MKHLSGVFAASPTPLHVRMQDEGPVDAKDLLIGMVRKTSLEENTSSAEQHKPLDGRQLTPRSPPSQLNSSGHSTEDDEESLEVLHGFFKVEEAACKHFKGTEYIAIQLTDPNIDNQEWLHTQGYRDCLEICGQCSNLKRIPLSIVQEALGNHETAGKPVEIKWEERVLNLTFVEKGGLSKNQLLDQIAKNVLLDAIEEDDAEFLETTFFA